MKAIIEFDLPEENEAWEIYQRAFSTHCKMEEFRRYLRSMIKHKDPDQWDDLEKIYEVFNDIIAED